MPLVLVVEDDVYIGNMLQDLLAQNGYQPMRAYSGTEALLSLEKTSVDLVLLDLMLPGKTGDQVLSAIRQKIQTPVIALTAVKDRESKIAMLKSGADDYITKPFDNDELLARMEALLRRTRTSYGGGDNHKIHFKDIEMDLDTFEVRVGQEEVVLSKHEFEILKLLAENPKRVFTKNMMYETVWGDEFIGDDNTINVHISRIRAKLARANPHEKYSQTVWGIGFKMETG
jgi:two-component system, OmpR family, response regulator